MKISLKSNIRDPEMLEKLYREDKKAFKTEFDIIYPEIKETETAKFWKTRLEFDTSADIRKTVTFPEVLTVIGICLFVAFLIKIPALFQIHYSEETFYLKNASTIVFFGLTIYTILLRKINTPKYLILVFFAFLVPTVYVNLLPSDGCRASVNLVYIHLPLLMWFIFGVVFTQFDFSDLNKRIGFIRYNGDLAIIYALLAIAGGMLSAITIGLFSSIGVVIEELYAKNVIMTGAAATPVVGSYLIEKYPSMVSRTVPLIATLFSPMVLITLVIFLLTMLITGKDPYNDREFLLTFNLMLLGVMVIIIFSVSESSTIRHQRINLIVLFALSVITIIIDLIALSAIFYRLGEFGLTPNRLAVLVSNVLVLINLVLIMADFIRIAFKRRDFRMVEFTTVKFLPVYLVWIIIVVFGFPLFFGFN